MANTVGDPPVKVLLSCGHKVPTTKRVYLSAGPPMEWCHTCKHARFVKGWV